MGMSKSLVVIDEDTKGNDIVAGEGGGMSDAL